ncbi:hypothetical protein RFI_10695 [Reticulomyxa filosa]|uniref:Uncharacterized protein n=1 Tax=Reticulomyxa filosa TaxID=46433 RepID=X6NM46_RETFI|nr:hypothetical protein RFI_10695 [Reticulomyxa filosa]|eukprot:ETO26442.1 hypothetical protein RFI_10695 [Reticulomyxa filosa]
MAKFSSLRSFVDDLNIYDWLSLVCMLVNLVVYTPLMLYYTKKYMERRKNPKLNSFYKSRGFKLLLVWLLSNYFWICVNIPIVSMLVLLTNESTKRALRLVPVDHKHGNTMAEFSYMMFISFLFISGIVTILGVRVWKLYFDQCHLRSMLDCLWKQKINAGFSNWFLSTKTSFGSTYYVVTRIAIPAYLIVNCFSLLCS